MLGIEDPGLMERLLAPLGLSPESELVAYDSSGGLNAARLGWTLERFGFYKVRVLDGGLLGWLESGLPVSQEVPEPGHGKLRLPEANSANCFTLAEVEQALANPEITFWDCRSGGEWRSGRIPGAQHLEWTELLDETGRLLQPEGREEKLERAGLATSDDIVVYCAGGIRAAHGYWVLRSMGYRRVRVFDGSWAQYESSGLPVES